MPANVEIVPQHLPTPGVPFEVAALMRNTLVNAGRAPDRQSQLADFRRHTMSGA